jgi:futalosine hydrolase
MRIVLAAATEGEISSTMEWLKTQSTSVEVLITGIGGTITAYTLAKSINMRRPDLIIQAGIGGSFIASLPVESIAFINEEVFADLGAIDEDGLVDIFDLGLAGINDGVFANKRLPNPNTERWKKYGQPFMRGATINCISSTKQQVQRIIEKYDPAVESMEGAALHYVCLREEVPFIQLRSISNFVGERDKKKWKMKEAIEILNEQLKKIIADL